ncbi:uncharacterized protein LOC122682513 isoform X2 [Cervus elaphus]|uniref:uncharacterized protein LOC122682513 isoform X2 n=1 Tax=Cervus elaphus TaxID=9860 RepID=UPI001CC2E7D4|nr:uncharacterized protein LOC122682513 isoform X2 [Cervus elaphus]
MFSIPGSLRGSRVTDGKRSETITAFSNSWIRARIGKVHLSPQPSRRSAFCVQAAPALQLLQETKIERLVSPLPLSRRIKFRSHRRLYMPKIKQKTTLHTSLFPCMEQGHASRSSCMTPIRNSPEDTTFLSAPGALGCRAGLSSTCSQDLWNLLTFSCQPVLEKMQKLTQRWGSKPTNSSLAPSSSWRELLSVPQTALHSPPSLCLLRHSEDKSLGHSKLEPLGLKRRPPGWKPLHFTPVTEDDVMTKQNRKKLEDAMLLPLEMEDRVKSQEMQEKARKHSPLEPLKGTSALTLAQGN